MKVRELIAILSEHDPDMTVLVDGYEYGFCDLQARGINVIHYFRDVNHADHAGPHGDDSEGDEVGLVLGRK